MKRLFLDFRKVVLEGLETTPIDPAIFSSLTALKQKLVDSTWLVMLGCGKSAAIMRHFHHLQRDLILLSDLVFMKPKEEENSQFCKLAQTLLIQILESLQRYGSDYFDRQQIIPLWVATEVKTELEGKLTLLSAGLKKQKIESKLQEVVLAPFRTFGTKDNNYLQLDYLLKYIDQFIAVVQHGPCGEDILLANLLHSGFNTARFDQYYKEKMVANLNVKYKVADQLEYLYDCHELFQCLPKKPLMCYDSRNPSCRASLLNFVNIKIDRLNKTHQVNRVEPIKPEGYRLKTSLSVDGFAYLLRLLVESGVIEANPRTQLMAFMSAHIQTCGKGEGNVSADSLITKYKQVNQNTALGIKLLFVKMTNQVQKGFNV